MHCDGGAVSRRPLGRRSPGPAFTPLTPYPPQVQRISWQFWERPPISQRAFTSLHVRQVYDDRQPRYEPPRSNRQVRIVWQLRCASENPGLLDWAFAPAAEARIRSVAASVGASDVASVAARLAVMNPERMTTGLPINLSPVWATLFRACPVEATQEFAFG